MALLVLAAALAGVGLLALRYPRRVWAMAFGLILVAEFALAFDQWNAPQATAAAPVGTASRAQVLALVRASNSITSVPSDIDVPPRDDSTLAAAAWGGVPGFACFANYNTSTLPGCVYGDTSGTRTMVFYGDSHVQQWFQAVDAIATRDRWKLVILSKAGCPVSSLAGRVAPLIETNAADRSCRKWHTYVAARINKMRPDLLVVTEDTYKRPDGSLFTPQQWQQALTAKLRQLHAGRIVVLGNNPTGRGPDCLLKLAVQACATRFKGLESQYVSAERNAARATGARYVDVIPWFCAARCSPVIGHFNVYFDANHITRGYSEYLEGVLTPALGM
jgi:hypothetical protein